MDSPGVNLKAQYVILNQLKEVDDKYFRIKADLNRIPGELDKVASSLSTKKQTYEGVRNETSEFEKSVRKFEMELKDWEDRLSKAEVKMREVKTNEEYKAAMKENDVQKAEKGKLEEKILSLMGDMESRKTKLKEAETVYKDEEKTAETDRKEVEKYQTQLNSQLSEVESLRKEILAKLPKETLALYEKTLHRVNGAAPIVKLDKGLCPSCQISIRPQIYNEILGFKAIHRCNSCGKILIIPMPNENTSSQSNSVL